MADQKTIDFYDAQVEAYVAMIKDQPHDHLLLPFIEQVKPGGHVLDLGCGPGNLAAVMIEHGLTVDPVDASAEMVRLANEEYGVGARQALFEEINGEHLYDGIWANFSLLHASADSLPALLANLHRATKPEGVFHMAVKLGAGSKRDKLGRMYAYYSKSELLDLLSAAGFKVEKVDTGELPGLAGDVEPWIALLSRAR